ncbi:MAG TPA: hypothetical protein ENK78_03540 [Thiothrix sp.]|nr:hypothetical protein [Thiothrix sp.]
MKLTNFIYPLLAFAGTTQAQVLYPSDVERIKAIYAAEQAVNPYAVQNPATRSLSSIPSLNTLPNPMAMNNVPVAAQNYQVAPSNSSAVRPYPAYARQLAPATSASVMQQPVIAPTYNPYRITPANPILTANTYKPYQQNARLVANQTSAYRPQTQMMQRPVPQRPQNLVRQAKPAPQVHSWGIERHIWPDFYTDFTSEAWDWAMRSPRDLGYMPGGWRFPYVNTPDPVTVSDAIANQVPPILEEIPNFAPTP